jgi:hypothetical protein
LIDRAAGDNGIGVPERQFRHRTHDVKLPIIKLSPRRERADASNQRGHDSGSRGDLKETTP